jgi:hypothetical protein
LDEFPTMKVRYRTFDARYLNQEPGCSSVHRWVASLLLMDFVTAVAPEKLALMAAAKVPVSVLTFWRYNEPLESHILTHSSARLRPLLSRTPRGGFRDVPLTLPSDTSFHGWLLGTSANTRSQTAALTTARRPVVRLLPLVMSQQTRLRQRGRNEPPS